VPLGFGGMSAATIRVEGYEPAKDETVWTSVSKVGPNYCRVMEIPLVRGRDVAPQDTNDAPAVAVINETLARRYWRGSDPVGRRILWGDRAITIVGIVRDSKYRRLDETPFPVMLVPLQQHYDSSLTILIRTEGDPARMSASLHSAIGEMDSNLPIFATRTFENHVGAAAFRQRFASTLLSVFGALALFLAAIGVYGVISCTVTQQTREFGIRIALGARPQDLLWWVVRHGMGITASGIAIGLAAAWGVTRVLRSLLLGVHAYDPLTFAGVGLVLALVSLAACLIPARRAARVDPIISLRYE
jgi:predicted permease